MNTTDLPSDVLHAKRQIIDRLQDTVQIYPLSANEFVNTKSGSKKAMFDHPADSGVPAFLNSLSRLAQQFFQESSDRSARRLLQVATQAHLAIKQREVIFRARIDGFKVSENLRSEFKRFAQSERTALAARQGEFNAFIKTAIPAEIDSLAMGLRVDSSDMFRRYCVQLKAISHMTLKAAIRREGTYSGAARVDIQGVILDAICDRIAVRFKSHVVSKVRAQSKQLTKSNIDGIAGVLSALDGHSIPKSLHEQIENVRLQLENNMSTLEEVGEERLKSLSQEVRVKIVDALREVIATKFEEFLESDRSKGPGVKVRMLDLVEEVGIEAIKEAIDEAKRILVEEFNRLYVQLVQRDLKALNRDVMKEVEQLFDDSVQRLEAEQINQLRSEITPVLESIGELYDHLTPVLNLEA